MTPLRSRSTSPSSDIHDSHSAKSGDARPGGAAQPSSSEQPTWREQAVYDAIDLHLGRRSARTREVVAKMDLNQLKTATLEVTLGMMAGDTNLSIARRLGISVSSVKYQLAKMVRAGADAFTLREPRKPRG